MLKTEQKFYVTLNFTGGQNYKQGPFTKSRVMEIAAFNIAERNDLDSVTLTKD